MKLLIRAAEETKRRLSRKLAKDIGNKVSKDVSDHVEKCLLDIDPSFILESKAKAINDPNYAPEVFNCDLFINVVGSDIRFELNYTFTVDEDNHVEKYSSPHCYIKLGKRIIVQSFLSSPMSYYQNIETAFNKQNLKNLYQEFTEKIQDSSKVQFSKSKYWETFLNHLTQDSLYEQDEFGEKLTDICQVVEDKLGYYVEPSIQGRQGGVWIYDNDTNEILVDGYDYETFNDEIIDIAINSSSKKEFMTKYKNYLKGLTK